MSKWFRKLTYQLRNILLICILALGQTVTAVGPFLQKASAANPSANLDQYANSAPAGWQNGDLNDSNSEYKEGDSVPFRIKLDNLSTAGSHTVTIQWDTTKGGKHAYDYLTSYNRTVGSADPCIGVAGCGSPATFPIPDDPNSTVTQVPGSFTLYNGTITSLSAYALTGTYAGDSSTSITITFTTTVANPVLAWGGHIASEANWGVNNGAGAVSGSPYHMRLLDLDGQGGNQDRSLKASAVIQLPNITVVKYVDTNGDGVSDRTANAGEWSFSLDGGTPVVTNASGQVIFADVSSGTHTITESGPSDYHFATGNGTNCVFSGGVATATVAAGNPSTDATCNFTNSINTGSITISKDAIPNGAQDFAFTANGTGVSNFSLDDDNDPVLPNSKIFSNLVPGNYTFTESAVSGWDFDNISCSQGASVQKSGASVTVNLGAGQNVTCTYTNRQRGHIVVHKVTNPANDPTGFQITASGTGNIGGNATQTVTTSQDVTYDVAQGTYNVSEQVPSGWTQTSNTCSNLIINGNTPLINGVPTLTCTITNTKLAKLKIVKDALPNGPQSFSFVTSGTGLSNFALVDNGDPSTAQKQFVDLAPGSYAVTESSVPGWSLTGLTCDTNNYTVNSATVTVNLAAGQTTNCTFTNTKLVSISGTKYTSSATGALGPVLSGWTIFIDANGNGILDNGELSTVTDANGNYSFSNLLPGSFTLNEVLLNGWTQIFGPQTFNLTAGQTATNKDFGNFQNGGISGFKWNDLNGDGVAGVNEPKLAGWTINLYRDSADADIIPDQLVGTTVTDSNGNYSFSNLSPLPNRYYAVCEVQQAGWTQTFPAGNACHNIEMDQSGETNTNTNFGNQGRGTIRVIKNVDSDGNGTIDFQDVTNWKWDINGSGNFNTGSSNGQPVAAGSYTVSEQQQANYHVVSVVCDTQINAVSTSAQVVVAPGANVTCTFVNARDRGTLKLVKTVVNNDGGTASSSAFTLHVKQNGSDVAGSPAAGSATGTLYTLTTGSYTVSENTPPSGYQQTSIVCDGQATNQVTLTTDTTKTCIITNDDIAPRLTVIKHVINDNSGTLNAGNFTMQVNGTNVAPSASFPGSESGTTVTLNAGAYTVGENPVADYTASLSVDCTGTIALGQTKTCTITNNDNPHPGIHVVKSGPSTAHEGDVVTYTFTVTNTGDTVLLGTVINDNVAGLGVYQSGDTNNDGKLDKTETWIYSKQYTIPTPQVANVVNTVQACATDPAQTQVCDTDEHVLDVLHPSINVIKSGPALAYEGQIVGYNFLVTNTGDTTLFGVGINDDIATSETCVKTTLTAGESTTCSAIYLIPIPTTDDVTNTVIASGTDVLGRTVTDTDNHTLDVIHPSIQVVKSGPTTAHEGDTVTYTFTVTNTGDTPLSSTTVTDNVAGNAVYQSGDTNSDGKLDLTETWVFTKQYTIPENQTADVVNTATACGYDPIQIAKEADRVATCDTDTHTLDVLHPALNVVKSGPATAHPGDTVTYTFTVTNVGDTPLSSVTASDSIAGNGVLQSGDTNANGQLDLTETWIYTVDYLVPVGQESNIDNTVTVCGSDSLTKQVCDTDTHHLVVLAKVIVTKYNDLNRNGQFDPEDQITPEATLPGWTMRLNEIEQVTGSDGTTTYVDVTPDQLYQIDEVQQDGWHLSNIACDADFNQEISLTEQLEINLDILPIELPSGHLILPTPGQTVHCFIGNYHDVVLDIAKTNNRPNPTTVGDTVTYTLTVTMPQDSGASFNTSTIDLPPKNFTYVPGSWTAQSSLRGDLKSEGVTTEPTYGSPGTWLLGTMLPGEVVTLTYRAVIGSSVSAGTYPDVAFAQGCGLSNDPCVDDEVVFSNLSFADEPFVGTAVTIVGPQVLGANTTVLVNTGATALLASVLTATALLGATLIVARRRPTTKGGRK